MQRSTSGELSGQDEPTREERVAACLAHIGGQPDFPAFSNHIRDVMCAVADEASLRALTNLVLRDYSLTARVLRTGNSAYYNRSGRPVLSVAHAVALMGVEAVRDLAASLALIEHFRQQPASGLKELILLSLLTASHAQAVAEAVGFPKREDAYVCGMFRNLGEVLIACYFPREYTRILPRVKEGADERAISMEVLHFTYEDLGRAMVTRWNLPDKLGACMVAPAPPAAGSRVDLLVTITGFSHALSNAVYRGEPDRAAGRLKRLVEDYMGALVIDEKVVSRILDTAIHETKSTFGALRIPLDELRLRRQAEAALAESPVCGEPPAAAQEDELRPEELIERLFMYVQGVVDSREFELDRVLLMSLEAVYRGGPFDRVLLCLADEEHTHVTGRLGLGEGSDALRDEFRIPISLRGGPLGAALLRKQDMFLEARTALSRAEAQLLKSLGAACCGINPLIVDGVLGGCVYYDRASGTKPPPRTVELIGRLRDVMAKAIALRSSGVPA